MSLPDTKQSTTVALHGIGAVFDHAAVAAARIRDLLPIYQEVLGGHFLRGGDTERVGYRALQLGYPNGTKLELMEPLPGSTFFERFFARTGGGLHHITFTVPDMNLAVDTLRNCGYSLTGLFLDDTSWQEVFFHPREAHGTLVQIAHSEVPYPESPENSIEAVLAGRGFRGTGQPSP